MKIAECDIKLSVEKIVERHPKVAKENDRVKETLLVFDVEEAKATMLNWPVNHREWHVAIVANSWEKMFHEKFL